MKKIFFLLISLFFFLPPSFALFDTGTALDKGKLELDVAINPFKSITYGQSFIFYHYGLGNKFESHGYVSKHGNVFDWENSIYELYSGILKQWAETKFLDLATVVGIRKVLHPSFNYSLIGPGILYTLKINDSFRLAGHLQYIGDFLTNGEETRLRNYNNGYTWELGGYYRFNPKFELAFGAFTNSTADVRPIYTLNFYL